MDDDFDASLWIEQLQNADRCAEQAIWDTFFDRLVRVAAQKLRKMPRRDVDEEDVALSAMNSFYSGARAGRFPDLANQDDLWRLLVAITARKAIKHQRRYFALKRGGGRVRGDSVFGQNDVSPGPTSLDDIAIEPREEFADLVSETCDGMIEHLGDATLQRIARCKLLGDTNAEIAAKLDCTVRTVERKLRRIRANWSQRGL